MSKTCGIVSRGPDRELKAELPSNGLSSSVSHEASTARVEGSTLFDPVYYRSASRLQHATNTELAAHYVREGELKGLQPNPLFDPVYYRSQLSAPIDYPVLLTHYLEAGWQLGLRPHPLFDTAYYCKFNPEVIAAGVNPLVHFLASGGSEGRRPHPLFHSWYYQHLVRALRNSKENPLLHYLRQGWREGFDPHPSFNGNYYLDDNPDVAYSGQNPLVHFVLRGFAELRRPHPLYSTKALSHGQTDPGQLDDDILLRAVHLVERKPEEDHAICGEKSIGSVVNGGPRQKVRPESLHSICRSFTRYRRMIEPGVKVLPNGSTYGAHYQILRDTTSLANRANLATTTCAMLL